MITKMQSVLAIATVAMMVGTVSPALAKTNELGWRKHSAYANQLYHRTAQWRWGNLRMARPGAFARMQEPGWREHYPYAGQAYSLARSLFGRRTWTRISGWIRSQRVCSLKGAAAAS